MTRRSSRRMFHFAPIDRTGWLLGMSGTQCVIVAAGIFTSGALMQTSNFVLLWTSPSILATVIALSRWKVTPLHRQLMTRLVWMITKRTKYARWQCDDKNEAPPFMAAYSFASATLNDVASNREVGVVMDQSRGLVSATMQIFNTQFTLLDDDDQCIMLDQWGRILASIADNSPVAQISFSEVVDQSTDAYPQSHGLPQCELQRSYRQLVSDRSAQRLRHSAFVTITVAARRCGRGATLEKATNELVRAAQGLHRSIQDSDGLSAKVLTCDEVSRLVKQQLFRQHASSGLSQLAGILGATSWPSEIELDPHYLRCEQTYHRAYLVSDWPRRDVSGDWIEPFLMTESHASRIFTVVATPIPEHRSRARITRDATRLATDEEQRHRAGFRIGADHRRNAVAVEERELELLAGHAEFEFFGVVRVTASTAAQLDLDGADAERDASRCGMSVTPLSSTHDLGVLATLPVPFVPRRSVL